MWVGVRDLVESEAKNNAINQNSTRFFAFSLMTESARVRLNGFCGEGGGRGKMLWPMEMQES